MYKKNENFVKAYGDRPILIIEIEKDSLFIVSDTLLSYEDYRRTQIVQVDTNDINILLDSQNIDPIDTLAFPLINEELDTIKTLVANKRVKIFKSDFQAMCDSLYFNAKDSVFHLIGNPIMWSDSSQFVGDTIFVFMRKGKIFKMEIIDNGFISSTKDALFFNQIKGKKVTAFMVDGKVDRMNVKGNAETVYYIMDDSSAYIGVNQLICSEIWVYFKGGQVNRIVNLDKPDGHSFPMRGTDHEALKLRDFIWLEDLRPKTSQELFKQTETLELE